MAKSTPKWRNVLIWSAAGAVVYGAVGVSVALILTELGDVQASGLAGEMRARIAPEFGLALLALAVAWVGLANRNRPFTLRSFFAFAILTVVSVAAFLLIAWGFSAFGGVNAFAALGPSEWVATGVGLILVLMAIVGSLMAAIAHKGAFLMDAEAAEDMRERARMIIYSYIAIAASGLVLILLSIGGPVMPLTVALVGAPVLFAVAIAMSIAAWRLFDEMDRTLSYEAGNMSFYLIVLLGGAWAMLAHLRVVAGPAPLDWLTMFTVLSFVASIIAAGRRGLMKEH